MTMLLALPFVLSVAALFCIGGSIGGFAYFAARLPADAVELGHRGLVRARARNESAAFRISEPVVRALAVAVAALPCHRIRAWLTAQLACAGDHLGLSADELIAISLMQAGAGGVALAFCSDALGVSTANFALLGVLLGLCAPYTRLRNAALLRRVQIDRGLPEAIDLLSLCMSAGIDFGGGLQLLLQERSQRYPALNEELERIVQALALGQTRRDALFAFAERSNTAAASDFVSAVTQAERSGTPLRTVLEIQARMLRMRRSVLAEELAARAAMLLMGPLCLLLCAILIVLFGPFLVNGIGV